MGTSGVSGEKLNPTVSKHTWREAEWNQLAGMAKDESIIRACRYMAEQAASMGRFWANIEGAGFASFEDHQRTQGFRVRLRYTLKEYYGVEPEDMPRRRNG